MILYHVSFDSDEFRKLFIPRIPKSIAEHEDSNIPRICFSDSIDNCLSALSDVEDSMCESHYINVYSYLFSTNDKNLISYEELYNKGFVPDALFTHEYWYCKEIYLPAEKFEILNYEADSYFLIHEDQRKRLFSYLESECGLTNKQLKYLSEMSCSEILNEELYNEEYWRYVEPSDIAEYLHCANLMKIYNVKLKKV